MTASLPMYDRPGMQGAHDRLWSDIRARYGAGPASLDRTTDPHETWEDPALVLSQTCGLPFRRDLHRRVSLVGTPDYGVEGCPPGYYRSCVVVRKTDPRTQLAEFAGAHLARNDPRSQSGWAAIEAHLTQTQAGFSFAGHTVDTGSHAASARAVAEDQADIAALDAVTWALMIRDDPVCRDLRVLLTTRPTPGLPLITGPAQDAARLFLTVEAAIGDLSVDDRATLMLRGVVRIPATAYLAEPMPPAETGLKAL